MTEGKKWKDWVTGIWIREGTLFQRGVFLSVTEGKKSKDLETWLWMGRRVL